MRGAWWVLSPPAMRCSAPALQPPAVPPLGLLLLLPAQRLRCWLPQRQSQGPRHREPRPSVCHLDCCILEAYAPWLASAAAGWKLGRQFV